MHLLNLAARVLLPGRVHDPAIWNVPCLGVDVDVHTELIVHRPGYHHGLPDYPQHEPCKHRISPPPNLASTLMFWSRVTQGMLVGWGILSPVSKYSGWAPGPVGDMTVGARGWILWVSLAIMCSDSVVSLVPVVVELVQEKVWRTFRGQNSDMAPETKEVETEDRLVPMSWVVWGLSGSVVLGTILVWLVFGDEGIKPWATLIGFVMGGLLSVLGWVPVIVVEGPSSCIRVTLTGGICGGAASVRWGRQI